MPDDPIQDNQDQTTSQPEPTTEETKPAEENPQPDAYAEVSTKTEENPTPEPPKEETPAENPAPSEPEPEKKPEDPTPEEQKPNEEKKSEENNQPEQPKEEAKFRTEPTSEGSGAGIPVEVIKEVKVVDEAELGKKLDEKLKAKLLENKKKANEARIQRKKNNLDKIVELAKKKEINNQDVRDLLQVSQSTATTYLTELTKSGRLKSEKKAKAKVYKGIG